jgi:FKBP-type peptidyl-prolyl cis-trans isomerase
MAAIAMALALAGCQDPPELVPVAPPGVETKKLLPTPEADQAQAVGELADAVVIKTVSPPTKVGETKTTDDNLRYTTLKEGGGAEAQPGKVVTVHFVGTFPDGQKFDSSRDRGESFSFQLGKGYVIRGWDEGISGMMIGERRRLVIPPELGYGPTGKAPVIPANATLIFEVELLDVRDQ